MIKYGAAAICFFPPEWTLKFLSRHSNLLLFFFQSDQVFQGLLQPPLVRKGNPFVQLRKMGAAVVYVR